MIPKVIHYMWFGGNPLPKATKQYIESWKKFCPDYEIKEWNESNFNIRCCRYVEEAYNARKWAFVSDYARFYVLYDEGGIYLDTDIEVLKPFDPLLGNKAFYGFADEGLTLPIFGSQAGQPSMGEILQCYNSRVFIKDGLFDTTPIDVTALLILKEKYGLIENGRYQVLCDGSAIYPKEYFYSTDASTGVITRYPELYIIHYADGSWLSIKDKSALAITKKCIEIFGQKFGVLVAAYINCTREKGLLFANKKFIDYFIKSNL